MSAVQGALVSAVAAAAALWFAFPRPRPAVRRDRAPRPRRAAGPVVAAAGVGTTLWVVVGGLAGTVAGVVGAALAYRFTAARPSRATVRAEQAAREDLPHLTALLASCLRSGADPVAALGECARALPGPAADRLAGTLATAGLGAPLAAWRELSSDPALGRLGRVLARAHTTGAPVADAVDRLADDLCALAHADAEDRARRVGVRAAVPLGLCLLPAFMVLGIVPVVASVLGAVLE